MIEGKYKKLLGETIEINDRVGIIVGLTEIPNYSPYDNSGLSLNSEIDKCTMFIVSLESGETLMLAPCSLITATSPDRDWCDSINKNKVLKDLRIYQKREITKIGTIGASLRWKFLKYPEYNRFNKNLDNLKLEVVLWERL